MSKSAKGEQVQVEESEVEIQTEVVVEVESNRKPVEITFEKYLHIGKPDITQYQAAYVGERFRGIMKSKDSWDTEMIKIMKEGDR